MAEPGSLMTKIDRISYIAAGVVGVLLLALPFLLGGGVAELSAEVEKKSRDVEELVEEDGPALIDLEGVEVLEKQWASLGATSDAPRWVTEVKPVLIRTFQPPEARLAEHGAPQITEVECLRNSEKQQPYLRVTGETGTTKHATLTGVTLLRQEGTDGTATAVEGFQGTFPFDDYDVKSGQVYFYGLQTTAEIAEGSKWADGHGAEKKSDLLGPTEPVPYDLSFRIVSFNDNDPQNPKVTAKIDYWDYEKGEAVMSRTPDTLKEGDPVAGGRFTLRRIYSNRDEVVLRSEKVRSLRIKKMRQSLPVKLWDTPLTGSGVASEEPPPAEKPTAKKSTGKRSTASKKTREKKETEKESKPSSRSRRGFK